MTAAPDAISGLFGDLVGRLERLAPRSVVLTAMSAALDRERSVDGFVAAIDAEESERK